MKEFLDAGLFGSDHIVIDTSYISVTDAVSQISDLYRRAVHCRDGPTVEVP